jgi:hypothetical protein
MSRVEPNHVAGPLGQVLDVVQAKDFLRTEIPRLVARWGELEAAIDQHDRKRLELVNELQDVKIDVRALCAYLRVPVDGTGKPWPLPE